MTMLDLTRTVRFCVDFVPRHGIADGGGIRSRTPGSGDRAGRPGASLASPRLNTFAAWPSMAGVGGLGAYYELEVCCRGEADPLTGYMLNISAIDEAVRTHGLPLIMAAIARRAGQPPALTLRDVLEAIQTALRHSVASIRWRLTPYYSITMSAAAPDRVSLAQQFEFSAAHRLNCAALSPAANREVFGKCNNPNGHGHNYRLEAVVAAPLAEAGQGGFGLADLERIVHEMIVQRFDHKHLNLDTVEFAALNPSVEHITRVCHDLLVEPLRRAGGELQRVTVWETEKTSCTYPAAAPR